MLRKIRQLLCKHSWDYLGKVYPGIFNSKPVDVKYCLKCYKVIHN